MTDASPAPSTALPLVEGTRPEDLETLGRNALLRHLSIQELERFLESLDQVAVTRASELVAESILGDYTYFVLEGEARMAHSQMGTWDLGPGDHFGELALLGVKYTSTVSATTTMRLARLSRARYLALGETHPALALHFT